MKSTFELDSSSSTEKVRPLTHGLILALEPCVMTIVLHVCDHVLVFVPCGWIVLEPWRLSELEHTMAESRTHLDPRVGRFGAPTSVAERVGTTGKVYYG